MKALYVMRAYPPFEVEGVTVHTFNARADIDLNQVIITTPSNKIGFQMNPSRYECEKTLSALPSLTIITISVLASCYLVPVAEVNYVASSKNIKGVAAEVSTEQQTRKTFIRFNERFASKRRDLVLLSTKAQEQLDNSQELVED